LDVNCYGNTILTSGGATGRPPPGVKFGKEERAGKL